MLALVTQSGATMPSGLRVYAALMAIELLSLLRIPNLRLFLAFGVPYFAVFPLLLPLDDFGPAAAVMLMAVVFLFCSSLKSNVLGMDAATVRQYFTWPVSPAAVLRVRLTVLNLAVGLMCAEVIAVVALKGGLRSLVDVAVVGSAFASLLLATDAAGGRWSVRSPVAVSWGRAFPVANDAGSLVLGGVILAVTLLYAGLLAVMSRFALTTPVLLAALALPLLIAGWPWRQFRRWSVPALSQDRERLLAKLEV
ncbi:MAG: hypothetical protein H0X64_14925 [Gemmatimonadaceae bacterium]|nr:hypothetical protein [Gemmatimonadaceae bacterium]